MAVAFVILRIGILAELSPKRLLGARNANAFKITIR